MWCEIKGERDMNRAFCLCLLWPPQFGVHLFPPSCELLGRENVHPQRIIAYDCHFFLPSFLSLHLSLYLYLYTSFVAVAAAADTIFRLGVGVSLRANALSKTLLKER